MELLFTYGTLQDPSVQRQVFGRVLPGTPDILEGFETDWVMFGDTCYPMIFAKSGGRVSGQVIEVTPEELALSDLYETSAYRRIRVTLRSGAEAWVYCR